jgi:hypothetical protein
LLGVTVTTTGFGSLAVRVTNGGIRVREGVGDGVIEGVAVGVNVDVREAVRDGKAVFDAVGINVAVARLEEPVSSGSLPSGVLLGVGVPWPVSGMMRSLR